MIKAVIFDLDGVLVTTDELPYHGLNIACKGLCTKGHLKGFCILYDITASDLPTHRLYPKICFLYRYRRLGYERRKS